MGPEWVLLSDASSARSREPLDVFSAEPFELLNRASLAVAILVLGNLAVVLRTIPMQTKRLRRITMNFTRKTVHFLTSSFPRALSRVAVLAAVALVPVAAYASSPWVQAISNLANDFSGPIAKGLSLVAIVWGGVMLAFTEGGDSKRMIGGVILGVGMAIGAANFLVWITG
jgi:type IV secretion system protein TrbC